METLSDQTPHSVGTLANREDPDEMLHNGAFYHGLHSSLRIFRNKNVEKFRNFDLWPRKVQNGQFHKYCIIMHWENPSNVANK